MSERVRVPVLIVGGGPVGLALALDLARRGVASRVVERTPAISELPKMNHLNARSMELCRRWGIAQSVRNSGWPADYPMDVAYVTSLAGFEIARLAFPSHAERADLPDVPEPSQRCPQIWFEPLLVEELSHLECADLRRSQELVGFRETQHEVVASIHDISSESHYEVACDYLVGADGAGSTLRGLAGIERESFGPSPEQIAMAVRAKNFWSFHHKRRAAFFIVLDERGIRSFITPTDGEELWRFNWNLRPGERAEEFDPQRAVRALAGADFDFEILGSFAWQIRFTLAERFRAGRVFLVGDAAHTLSPTGGLGLNTGLADAADLGWKLAGRLHGWAGERLLDSYDRERRPVCRSIIEESFRNLARLASIPRVEGIEDEGEEGELRRAEAARSIEQGQFRLEWENEGAALGGRYDDSPVIVSDRGEPPPYDPNHYEPTSFPGCRAPHAWLEDGRSTLDLFDQTFTLLRLGAAAPPAGALVDAAEKCGLPLQTHDIKEAGIARRYERALVLVRPDGYVAWRGDRMPADPDALLDRVRGR